MATKNKKQIVSDLLANIFTNTTKQVTAVGVQVPFNDLINSISVNLLVVQLQAEDDSAQPSLVNIMDSGKAGIFYYDSTDATAADDGGSFCIVTSTGKRYKRLIDKAINAGWYGEGNYYFSSLADAQAKITAITRFVGLEVTAMNNGNLTTYWFDGGITNSNLVPKVREVFSIDFTVGDGGALTPADGTSVYTDPDLLGGEVVGLYVNGAKTLCTLYPAVSTTPNVYGQYNPAVGSNGTLTLINGTFNEGTYYSIQYK